MIGVILDLVLAGFLFVTYVVTYHGFWSYCYFKTIFLKTCIFIIAGSSLSKGISSDQSRKFADQTTNLNNKIIHATLHICRTYPPSTFKLNI